MRHSHLNTSTERHLNTSTRTARHAHSEVYVGLHAYRARTRLTVDTLFIPKRMAEGLEDAGFLPREPQQWDKRQIGQGLTSRFPAHTVLTFKHPPRPSRSTCSSPASLLSLPP